jgi:hypothetical protein
VRALLGDDDAVYEAAAAEAFPEHNKAHLVSLELPDRSGDVSTSLPLSLSLSLSPRIRFGVSYIHSFIYVRQRLRIRKLKDIFIAIF